MERNNRSWLGSIHSRMTLVIVAFCALFSAVTSTGIVGLRAIDDKMKSIARFGVVETHFFGQLADRLPELRLTELSVVHADSETERAEAFADLARERLKLGQLAAQLDEFPSDRIDAVLREQFRDAWKAYAQLHDSLFSETGSGRGGAVLSSPIHKAFAETEKAMHRLVEDSRARVARDVDAAEALSRSIMTAMVVAAAIATLAALALYLGARRTIFRPLRKITQALTALSQGRADIEIPQRVGRDEISQLSAAFRVFRANLAELKQAHNVAKIARRAAEAMAHQDPLTSLPNRRALAARLRAFFDGDRAAGAACALLIIDLDRFKPVNDLLGHMVGDLVLCAVAKRLKQVVSRAGLAARLGGDEFAVVAPLAGNAADQARALAERVMDTLCAPIMVGDHRIEIGASIGIALSNLATDPAGLMSAADIAMYRAKKGDIPICLFEPEMEGESRRRAELEKALRQALKAGEITPHYQPIVDLATRKLLGFEILARWRDPELGQVSPEIFIPVAEQRGLILDLSADLLAKACREAAHWPDDLVLSMNVSPVQLRNERFPEELLASLQAHGFSPRRLEIEITETALIGDVDAVRDILLRLRAAGIKISLDDFGMGFSSLNHLRQFKIDKVKIDRSFTKTILEDPESGLIVRSVIHLARGLNLAIVAEGIEDERTAEMMRMIGCDFGQGYHFGRAVPGPDAVILAARAAA